MSSLTVEPLTPTLGAVVSGVDLSGPPSPEEVAEIRQALLDHLVIFFKGQDLTTEEHIRFGRCFGELDVNPFQNADGDQLVLVLDQVSPLREDSTWHADFTHRPAPPMGSILRAIQMPSGGGGDTCFASMYAAYDALSPTIRDLLDGLHAVHTLEMMGKKVPSEKLKLADDVGDDWPSTIHPVVRVHPETGRKALYVNVNWTSRIIELTEAESAALLGLLFEMGKDPELQCRYRWEPGDVAFWDNRAVLHYPVPDYRERRIMERVTIVGDRPFGPTEPQAAEVMEKVGR